MIILGRPSNAFSTADIIRFLLDILENHFFHDCPDFVVLIGNFSSELSTRFALEAAEAARERELVHRGQCQTSLDELQIENYPLPTAPTRSAYEPDS